MKPSQFNPWTIETYALESETGHIKIGRCHPGRERSRWSEIEKDIGERVYFIGYLNVDERRAHRELADHRLHGEWFRNNYEVRQYVTRYLSATYTQKANQ